jgi:single-strand DNA-binding protein
LDVHPTDDPKDFREAAQSQEIPIMASYNRVILVGNLTKDPELRYIQSGTAVTELDLAVNDRRKNANGEWVEETTYINRVTVWGRQAETACEYLTKGSPVFIEGRLKYDTWEKDGQKHSRLGVVAERVQFLSSRGGQGGGGPQGGGSQGAARAPQRSSGPSNFNQSAPPDFVDDAPPPEFAGGGGAGGGDDIPF